MKIQEMLLNHNMEIYLFIFIGVSILYLLDNKIILSLILIIIVLVNYNSLLTSSNDIQSNKINIKKDEISDDMYYNSDIDTLLIKIKKFKKYNKVSYKQGVKYLRKFIKTINILEHDNIMNYNQYFENAHIYLKESINSFQSITISLPERGYIKAIKYGDFKPTKKMNELGSICKELYNECFYILYNLSIKFNKQWSENPNIYTKEIDINTDNTEYYNKNIDVNWSLY